MPIQEDAGHFVLRCVNSHGPEYMSRGGMVPIDPKTGKTAVPKSTMARLPDWSIIPSTAMESDGTQIVDVQHSAPVQIHVCRICGYVELYAQPWQVPLGDPSGEPNLG